MDPIDRLRALREDSRWTPAEFELDASAAAAVRPVRGRRVSGADARRHWLPRVGIGVLAVAAVAAVVVATVHTGFGTPQGFAGPAVGATRSAATSQAELPRCDWSTGPLFITGDYNSEARSYRGEIRITNTSEHACSTSDAGPSAQWVNVAGGSINRLGDTVAGTGTAERIDRVEPGEDRYIPIDVSRLGGIDAGGCTAGPTSLELTFDTSIEVYVDLTDTLLYNSCITDAKLQVGALTAQSRFTGSKS